MPFPERQSPFSKKLYFRIKDNGALIFRVDAENPKKQIELDQIGAVNIRSGQVNLQPDQTLSAEEQSELDLWIAMRKLHLSTNNVQSCIEQMNTTAHWIKSSATKSEVSDIQDNLLMAMHDLRQVIIRKLSD